MWHISWANLLMLFSEIPGDAEKPAIELSDKDDFLKLFK
jgi:hypothetical protein